MKKIRKIAIDTLKVSKLTKTRNKKNIIFISVLLSQAIAYLDIIVILFFTSLLTNNLDFPEVFNRFLYLFDQDFLLPIFIVFRYIFTYSQANTVKKLELVVQENLKVYFLSEVFYKKNYSIADTYYFINTLSVHISFFYTSVAKFLNQFLQVFVFTFFLFFTDIKTITVFLIGLLFLSFPLLKLIQKSREYMDRSYVYGQKTNKEIERIIDNLFLIKLLNKVDDELDRFLIKVKKLNHSFYNNHRFTILNSFLPSLITVFILAIITIYFSNLFVITLDFVAITLRLFQSIGLLSNSANQIVNSHVHLDKFYKLEKNKEIINESLYVVDPNIENSLALKFENVGFRFFNSEDFLFDNFSFKIPKNSHTLLTGSNGSGKSTVLGLIAGVYYPIKGSIVTHSNRFSYVGPNPLIFEASLLDNLTYGLKEYDENKLFELLNIFRIENSANQKTLDAVVNNKTLSSGQMQKIAFIRALLSNSDILLLDEATSNLDSDSKKQVYEYLNSSNLTIINSTHDDKSTLRHNNHLEIVFENEARKIIVVD